MTVITQNTDIEIFQQRWDGLKNSGALKLLDLAELSESHSGFIAGAKGDVGNRVLRRNAPYLLGHFRRAAVEEIMPWSVIPDADDAQACQHLKQCEENLMQSFEDEIKKVHALISHRPISKMGRVIGLQESPLMAGLHTDEHACYISNLAIAAEFLDQDMVQGNAELEGLVERASEKACTAEKWDALAELKERGAMKQGEVGGLYLICDDTSHCSGDFPLAPDGKVQPMNLAFLCADIS